ncbi:MAG: 2-phospho-L-lactate guanylyltransferase [Methanobacteriaceae archaeon]|nr:2-phospho-L-lactate guanylyltransferase [Methanobacteriaceae archaeon]
MNKKITAIIPVSEYTNAKTRLSPFLTTDERKQLLQYMLKDVVKVLKTEIDEIILISKCDEVLNDAKKLNITPLKEKGNSLNSALIYAIDHVHKTQPENTILILPSDIPLINENHINDIKNLSLTEDVIIAPSSGGGTNLLLFSNNLIQPSFGRYSFFEHKKQAKNQKIVPYIYDSFLLSLDMNIPTDLGELLLHGKDTYTYNYLEKLGVTVESIHGKTRLNVKKEKK